MNTKLLVLLFALAPLLATAQIEWRVSVKFILDANGRLPTNAVQGYGASSVSLTNHEAVIRNILAANQILDRHGRGSRYRLVEIVNLPGVSQWFDAYARDNRAALETQVLLSPALYAYRSDAINIYINNTGSGQCSFPGSGTILFAGADSYDTLLIHEMGHFFNLAHTFDTQQNLNNDSTPCDAGCGCARLIGGDDGIPDTLLDHTCWDRTQIAAGNPGADDGQIDTAFVNIMSYHIPQNRLTADQFDRMADISNSSRANVASGRTHFVAPFGDDLNGNGSSVRRYRTLAKGLSVAAPTDVVLLHAGIYDTAPTLNQPVTLAATRGPVTLRRP